MNKEIKEILDNFDNAINELPKTNNIASSFNGIKVEDLREAVKRFKHIPNYDELLKENKELKSRNEKAVEYIKEHNVIVVNKEYIPDGISTVYDYELMNILNGDNNE